MKHSQQMPRNLDGDKRENRWLTSAAWNSGKDMYFFKSIFQHREEHIQIFLELRSVLWAAQERGRQCPYLCEKASTAYSEVRDGRAAHKEAGMLAVCFCCQWPALYPRKTSREETRGGVGHDQSEPGQLCRLWATLVQEQKIWGKMCP